MKKIYLLSMIAVALAFVGVSCGENNNSKSVKPPAAQSAATKDPAWKVRITADCGQGTAKEQCLGSYGFQLAADGTFRVGPGPQGQLWTGSVEDPELKEVDAVVAKISPVMPRGTNEGVCDQSYIEGRYSVELGRIEWPADVALAKIADSKICHFGAKEAVEQLTDAARKLARKYYPVPFPDVCLDAVMAVHVLYQPLKECKADKDCANVDNTYQPVGAGELQFVMSDDCSLLRPLMVGNAALVQAQQNALLIGKAKARDACGDRMARTNCEGVRGYQSAENPPVCVNRECRVNPAAMQ